MLALKQADKALPLFTDFLAGRRERLGRDDLRIAGVLASVGNDLLKHGQEAAAEKVLNECLSIRAKKQPDDWHRFSTTKRPVRSLPHRPSIAPALGLRAGVDDFSIVAQTPD